MTCFGLVHGALFRPSGSAFNPFLLQGGIIIGDPAEAGVDENSVVV